MEYYAITSQRLSLALSAIQSDVKQQALQLALYYWHFFLFTIIWTIIASYIGLKALDFSHETLRRKHGFIFLTLLLLSAVLVRGGFQTKPLSTTHALSLGDPNLVELSLNTPFYIYRSKNKIDPAFFQKQFFKGPEYLSLLDSNSDYKKLDNNEHFRKNSVVIIILESFAAEFTSLNKEQKSNTPFLDSLMKEGQSYDLAFANNRTSIDALPAILTASPVLMKQHWITSPYHSLNQFDFGHFFRKKGYETSFYHGGHNGTMYFDTYIHSLNFDRYVGFNEYPNKAHTDGYWGTPDHYFFNWYADELNRSKKPFFSVLFSLSSHQPYFIPEEFEKKFPAIEGEHPILRSIRYTDESLRLFFEKAKKMPWFQDTLFVITADHTASCLSKKYCQQWYRQQIPIVYFHGGGHEIPLQKNRITQHADILPTVLDLLHFDEALVELPKFGLSLNREVPKARVFYQKSKNLYMMLPPYFFSLDVTGYEYVRKLDIFGAKNELINKEFPEHLKTNLKKLKAYFQYYYQSLSQRKWLNSSPESDN